MPTPAERRALLFLAAVAALGLTVHGVRGPAGASSGAAERGALVRQLADVDSLIALRGVRRVRGATAGSRARATVTSRAAVGVADVATPAPLPGTERVMPVDMDMATAAEMERLPGIGPKLAARIVADREARGPFGSLAGLQRVKGVGPVVAARLQSAVTFSAVARPELTGVSVPQGDRRP